MRKTLILILALTAILVVPAAALAQQLVYVVRHAERADDPLRDQPDPALSATGEKRAARLATTLGEAGIRAIYVTQFKRTQQTAAPIAARLKLQPSVMPASVTALAVELKSRHGGDIVLLVAHSSTMPAIIKGLGGPTVNVDDSDYDSFFVVVPSTGATSRLKF